jgi:hypothetical protein
MQNIRGTICNGVPSGITGRPRKKYTGRIELFYFFWALRPGYYVQQCIFFQLFRVHFHTI